MSDSPTRLCKPRQTPRARSPKPGPRPPAPSPALKRSTRAPGPPAWPPPRPPQARPAPPLSSPQPVWKKARPPPQIRSQSPRVSPYPAGPPPDCCTLQPPSIVHFPPAQLCSGVPAEPGLEVSGVPRRLLLSAGRAGACDQAGGVAAARARRGWHARRSGPRDERRWRLGSWAGRPSSRPGACPGLGARIPGPRPDQRHRGRVPSLPLGALDSGVGPHLLARIGDAWRGHPSAAPGARLVVDPSSLQWRSPATDPVAAPQPSPLLFRDGQPSAALPALFLGCGLRHPAKQYAESQSSSE